MTRQDWGVIAMVLVVIAIAMYIGDKPETHHSKTDATHNETRYTTEDKQHQGCLKRTETYLLKPDTWHLVCPDGFVQHNGNYYIEKD